MPEHKRALAIGVFWKKVLYVHVFNRIGTIQIDLYWFTAGAHDPFIFGLIMQLHATPANMKRAHISQADCSFFCYFFHPDLIVMLACIVHQVPARLLGRNIVFFDQRRNLAGFRCDEVG